MTSTVSSHGLDLARPDALNLLTEVHTLLALEAHVLDDREYHRWLTLFTEDCRYWMPVDPLCHDPTMRLNVIYDDRPRMLDRIARLTSGLAYSEDPPTLTARSVSAIHVSQEDTGDLLVRSNFMVVTQRRWEQRQFAGRYTHRLVRQGDELRIKEKRVGLLGSDAPQRAMTFLF